MALTRAEAIQGVAPSYWQREYSPRSTIPNHQVYFDEWSRRAALTRARLRGEIDVAYGSAHRERLDVFRADRSSGTVIFIHGGYWRAFGKEDFSWVADTFVKAGLTVAVLGYPLLPAVQLADISRSISRAMNYLAHDFLSAEERASLVVIGHSAGAQLATHYLASAGTPEALECKIDAVVCVSGVFDLIPVLHAGIFAGMNLRPSELYAASPLYLPPPEGSTVLLTLGAEESREFHRQSERFADAWAECVAGLIRIPQRNHFSVIDDLYDPQSDLSQQVLKRAARTP